MYRGEIGCTVISSSESESSPRDESVLAGLIANRHVQSRENPIQTATVSPSLDLCCCRERSTTGRDVDDM